VLQHSSSPIHGGGTVRPFSERTTADNEAIDAGLLIVGYRGEHRFRHNLSA
jgi:hypothetical protein